MKKNLYILAIFSILALMSFSLTDFYSSMTKVDYIEGTKSLKFTTKLNTEHISNVIGTKPEAAAFDEELKKYVNRNFDVFVNDTQKNLIFTGSQINGESVWVYFEAKDVGEISSLKIKNSLLLETYPRQFNVVNIAFKGQQKTMNFSKGKEVNSVDF